MMIRFTIIAVCLVIDIIVSTIFVAVFVTWHRVIVLWAGGVLSILYLAEIVAMCFFWHATWRTIQDPHARTTPPKAIGFMFIPLFNLYWVFQLIWGFAKDYNAFCRRHGIGHPPHHLPAGYYLTVVIMWIVLVVLRYIPLAGSSHLPQYLRYHPTIGVIYGMCFSLAMLVLLYKTARAANRLTKDD
jgi:hypothetical protein